MDRSNWKTQKLRRNELLDDELAPVLSLVDLATNKRAAGRPKDLADLVWIERELKKSRRR